LKETSNVIKEYSIGNTKIKICDDYFVNASQEAIDTIIQNCNQIASNYFGDNS